MVVLPLPAIAPGVILAEIGWTEPLGLLVIALLVWRLWLVQSRSRAARAEQTRLLAEAREKTAESERARETLARETLAKSELLSALSRDIRGHLNGIMGAADLLVDPALKPRQREHLSTLRASAESLHQSLNDIVDFSSIETGQIKIAQAPFELRQPLTDVIETLSPLALVKGLELVLIVAPDVPQNVIGDIARLRQVLLNLTSNAVRFTTEGRVVLRLALASVDLTTSRSGGTWLHFSVSDTGPVIPDDSLATLFDRPSASATASPRNFGSAGLELAIVKRLVELMGGKIGARSLPEGGSEFWITLALKAESPSPAFTPHPFPDLQVVALDGLAAARIAVSEMLTRLGIDYATTDTVPQAVEMLNDALDAETGQLVLLVDESLASKNSVALSRALAPGTGLAATRVVLMSLDPEGVSPGTYDFPIATVLRKPLLRPEDLRDALRTRPGDTVVATGSRTSFSSGGNTGENRRPLVLVVDDDNISRSVSSQLLTLLDCQVEVVHSGQAAIARASHTHFDLIFMDCQMPEMDGYEATRRIIAASAGKAPPIVALTANTSPADREKCTSAGMSDFVAKPIHKADLVRILHRWTPRETSR
jgi:two-component system sensor histidine kinase/response regulator